MDRDALIKQLANIPEKKVVSKPVGTEELVGRLKEGSIFGKTRKEMAAYGITNDEFNEMAIRVSLGEDPKELFAELIVKKNKSRL